MEWIKQIARAIIKDEIDKLNQQLNIQIQDNENMAELLQTRNLTIDTMTKNIQTLAKESFELNQKMITLGTTELDRFCMTNFYRLKKYYKDKILVGDVRIDCDLRELITPTALMVTRLKESIKPEEDKFKWYDNIMRKVWYTMNYEREVQDTYYYPAYSLKIRKGDCEDFAFVQASVDPELGVAYGFLYNDGKLVGGHAFAVGIIDDKITIFDGVEKSTQEYNHKKGVPCGDYYIHYIVTKNEVYCLDPSVEFGDVLWS